MADGNCDAIRHTRKGILVCTKSPILANVGLITRGLKTKHKSTERVEREKFEVGLKRDDVDNLEDGRIDVPEKKNDGLEAVEALLFVGLSDGNWVEKGLGFLNFSMDSLVAATDANGMAVKAYLSSFTKTEVMTIDKTVGMYDCVVFPKNVKGHTKNTLKER